MAVAAALLVDKMEQFRSTPLDDPLWQTDGSDVVTYDTKFIRLWRVSGTALRTVTITVSAENALTRRQTELIGAATIRSSTF